MAVTWLVRTEWVCIWSMSPQLCVLVHWLTLCPEALELPEKGLLGRGDQSCFYEDPEVNVLVQIEKTCFSV